MAVQSLYPRLGVPSPFDPSCTFVTSPVFSPLILALFRLLLAVYATTTAIVVLVYNAVTAHDATNFTYFSYFTNLSYIGLVSYFWAAGVQTLFYALNLRSQGISSSPTHSYPLQRWPRSLQFLHTLLFSTVTTYTFIIVITVWSFLRSPDFWYTRYSAWSNISQHAFNGLFALLEILFTHAGAGPIPWLHIPFLVFMLGLYCCVAYISHATQGFYTYSFLDPQLNHGLVAAYIFGIGVSECVIFAITRYVIVLREWISSKRGTHREHAITPSDHGARGGKEDVKQVQVECGAASQEYVRFGTGVGC